MFVVILGVLIGAFAASAPIEIVTGVNIFAIGLEHYSALLHTLS